MKTIMARNPNDSFSFSRRYFNFKKKFEDDIEDDDEQILRSASLDCEDFVLDSALKIHALPLKPPPKKSKNLPSLAVSKIRAAFTFGSKSGPGLGTRVVGTLFGYRRGHVHFAFQEEAAQNPAFLVELATPTSVLVREMASGLVRIALECDRSAAAATEAGTKKKGGASKTSLLDEPLWRTYCNGRKCGYATRRECGAEEWKVLNAVGPITMGAGVLPAPPHPGGDAAAEGQGELMYMRAKFERVVGSRDSVAFYMMNPDGHGGPELSIYLLRV